MPSADHVWLNLRITAERRTACTGDVVVARYRALFQLTRGCVYQPLGGPTFEEHISATYLRFDTPKSEQLNQV